jgi:hypothetical protein
MQTLPFYVHVLFALITLITAFIFWRAANGNKILLVILLVWLGIQTILGISGFYLVTDTIPPRFLLLPGPPILLIAILFLTKKGRRFIDSLNIRILTLLHIIRIPVEIILFSLFLHHLIPVDMTFEGNNLDIISGVTAPIIYYLVFRAKKLNYKVLIAWNIVCLALLINVVTIAVITAPFPFQQFAFDQPNIGVLYFPFVWLPGIVVPIVLFSHLATLRQLIKSRSLPQS